MPGIEWGEDYEKNFFLKSNLVGGLLQPYRKYMQARGFTPEEAEQVRKLLDAHSGTSHQQAIADKQIVDELEANTRLGQAIEAKIDFEEAVYKEWIEHTKKQDDAWEKSVFDGQKTIYRKGDRKDGVEAWTTNEDGADMGGGGIGWDHKSTVESMFKEGYRLLGGAALAIGSPGEDEITFVKYKKKHK
jgi:hypothetical protein